jgi:hypothetical protein
MSDLGIVTAQPPLFGQRRAVINDNSISRVEKRSVPLTRLVALFWTWRQRATERGYLVTSDHRLRLDLLAAGQEIESEVAKPFWRS